MPKPNIKFIELLLKYGADPDMQNGLGQTALMFACRKGNINVIELLMQYKANPNIMNIDNKTALDFIPTSIFDYFRPNIIKEKLEKYKEHYNKQITEF